MPESRGRNVLVIAGWLLANTKTLTVATGIANIYARDPQATVSGQLALAEQSGGRFLLGLGVSHVPLVEGLRGHRYGKPVETMRGYVEAMRRASYAAPPPAEPAPLRYAATESNYGGGFIEMLFRGPGGAPPPQPQYQPEPQPAPMANPNHRRPQQQWLLEQDQDPLEPATPSVRQDRPAPNLRFDRQDVSYDGREKPGTVVINTRERLLYYVQANGRAIRYGIGHHRLEHFVWINC